MVKTWAKIIRHGSVLLVILLTYSAATGQIVVDIDATENTNCNGSPCDYNGPSILINELMLSPTSNDGSMWGANSGQRGEWIELYNPNICESIDISCYYLGNNANDGGTYPGGYVIPPGTVVPAAGFALIRGINAPPVPNNRLVENGGNVLELVVDGDGVCLGGGSRLWFPNSGGWFAFYDNNGDPQDAVSWASAANSNELPCVPTLSGCTLSGTLPHYDDFPNDRKDYILNVPADNFQGQSLRRLPDGGAWSGPSTATMANCNGTCAYPDNSPCNGTATAQPQSGTAPYTYLWDDPQTQTTQTAQNLCAGTYCVEITDANNQVAQQCITVIDADYQTTISAEICDGENYTLPDNSTTESAGEYDFTYQTAFGCDSVVTVNLDIRPVFADTIAAEICANQNYTLPNGSEVNTTGTYDVDYQSIHGCDSTYTVQLTVQPAVEVPLTAQFCTGTDYTLPDGTTVDVAGIHEALIPGGTDACDTLYVVNLQSFPVFEIEDDSISNISCHGQNDGAISITIDGSTGPYIFDWSDGEDHGTDAANLAPGNYSVQVTDSNGCVAEKTFEISEPLAVSISATADSLICTGSNSTLFASTTGGTGTFSYHWSHTASENATNTVSPTYDSTYTVFATDQNDCSTDTLSLTVEIISMSDTLLATNFSGPVCTGEVVNVGAMYAGDYPPYTYNWSNGLPDGPGPHSTTPGASTNYTVMVSDTCGNQASANLHLTIWPLPSLEINTSDVSCFGLDDGSAQISVSQGAPEYDFIWNDGLNHGANPGDLPPGNYALFVEDANGCTSTEVAFDLSEPQPVAINAETQSLVCAGSVTELGASATGGNGSFSYHWNHTTSMDSISVVSPTTDSTFTVYATDQNGCSSDTISLPVNVVYMDEALLDMSNDTAVCAGQTATIEGNYTGAFSPYLYTWNNNLDSIPGPHDVTPGQTTTYMLVVTDSCGNSVAGDVTTTINPLPEVTLSNALLSGCSPFSSLLTDSVNSDPTFSHQWSISNFGTLYGNPVNIEISEPGIYEVQHIVTSPEGCTATADNTLPIEVYPVPDAEFTASNWTTDINNPNITFTNTSQGAIWGNWRIMGSNAGDELEIAYTFPDTGRFPVQLLVENEYSCRDSLTQYITINIDHEVVIPNGFTPSGNGDNPNYDPESLSNSIFYPFSEYVADFQMSIFNRWGELIFESTEIGLGWNGTYRGKPCPQDVYVYKINFIFTDGKRETRVGDITLFR